jgi:hypothetical protein
MMDWLIQSGAALLALMVALVTIAFLVHMSLSSRPDARMAFLTGLMKGAMLEDESQNARSASSRLRRPPDSGSSRLIGTPAR